MTKLLKKFQRTIENFVCEKCGAEVEGNGYTNHCPKCLWSKHVDVNPGDRASLCSGMMKPISIEKEGDNYIITHECQKCGYKKRNKSVAGDDFDELIKI